MSQPEESDANLKQMIKYALVGTRGLTVRIWVWEFYPLRDTFIDASQNDIFEGTAAVSEVPHGGGAFLRIS